MKLCVLSHSGLEHFFSSKTLPETMIAIEASEADYRAQSPTRGRLS